MTTDLNFRQIFDPLNTEGGKIAIMVLLLVYIIAIGVHVRHDLHENGKLLLTNICTSVFTALMLKLTSRKNGESGENK